MKLSIFYAHIQEMCEQTGMTLEEALLTVSSLGIEAVECDIEQVRDVDKVSRLLKDCRINVSSVYGFFNFGKEKDYQKGYDFLDTAHELGARKVLIVPGFIDKLDKISEEEQLGNMVVVLNKLCEYARTKEIIVTMEDFDDAKAPYATDDQLLWFLERVPELKCTFDTGNFLYSEVDEIQAFEKLKNYIGHVHCKDRSFQSVEGELGLNTIGGRKMFSSPVGNGCIKMDEIIERLKGIGYDDVVAIEHFGSLNQLEYMKQSVEWLRKRI
ncbi:MAG TPA: sugar phosphate isomerase/epimerase [Lachnospiraceae bacterium]|nr:sugar phosphate isomerase/epimerase [Lachnospiraceae bacterium]